MNKTPISVPATIYNGSKDCMKCMSLMDPRESIFGDPSGMCSSCAISETKALVKRKMVRK